MGVSANANNNNNNKKETLQKPECQQEDSQRNAIKDDVANQA